MNPQRLADALTRSGALLGVNRQGQLVTDRVPEHLAPAAALHADELALTVTGTRSGHRWRPCTVCGRRALTAKAGLRCTLTPRCPGKYANPQPAPLANLVCCRPGCGAVAEVVTWTHEPLCSPDFLALALALDHQENHPQ